MAGQLRFSWAGIGFGAPLGLRLVGGAPWECSGSLRIGALPETTTKLLGDLEEDGDRVRSNGLSAEPHNGGPGACVSHLYADVCRIGCVLTSDVCF